MKTEAHHRMMALHLASQLPENADDAWVVLGLLSEIVDTFIAERSPEPKPSSIVKLFKEDG
jgi:hypothetical protein